jgi:hypothetical protein
MLPAEEHKGNPNARPILREAADAAGRTRSARRWTRMLKNGGYIIA